MSDDATKTILTTATGKLSGLTRTKAGMGVLTAAIAVSGLGTGLSALHHHTTAANAGSRHGKPASAQAAAGSGSASGTAGPAELYDSVTPSAVPAGKALATYVDGPYAQPQGSSGQHPAVWIDTNGTAPAKAQVLDVEPGDATPASAATWAKTRLDSAPHARTVIYTMTSQWDATKTALKATLTPGQYSTVKWWIADPTGTKHTLNGADAVQWWWGGTGQNPAAIGQTKDINVDVSTVKPSFWTQ